MQESFNPTLDVLERIAAALERLAPKPTDVPDFGAAEAFVWQADPPHLKPVAKVNRIALPLLKGIDRSRDILIDNTSRFAAGFPANNALLWGARGMGKSSLVKAVARGSRRFPAAQGAAAQADRDPPRGYRDPADADGAPA